MTHVPTLLRHATALCAAALLPHCAAMHGATFDGFDQGVLNATWYGPYSRPVDRASESERAQAAERARERAAASEARRAERLARRNERGRSNGPQSDEPRDSSQGTAAVDAPPRAPVPTVTESGDGYWNPSLAAEYVRATYALNDAPFDAQTTSITDIYRLAVRNSAIYYTDIPAAGDVVFFNHTIDTNNDGRDNDFYTHAGIIEGVDENGTITFLSFVGGEVTQLRMNLVESQVHEVDGEVYNSPLRDRHGADGSAAWLSSHLFAGFAAFLGPEVERVQLLDDWTPDEIGSLISSR